MRTRCFAVLSMFLAACQSKSANDATKTTPAVSMQPAVVMQPSVAAQPAIALQPGMPAAPLAAPTKARPAGWSPGFVGRWSGDLLPDAPLLGADGQATSLGAVIARPTIVALVPPNAILDEASPVMTKLADLARRFGPSGVDVLAVANWMKTDEFLAAARAHHARWPVAVYSDPRDPLQVDDQDAYERIKHHEQSFLGRLSGAGMTPALPACIVVDQGNHLAGSLHLFAGDTTVLHESAATLSTKAGARLAAEVAPKVAAPDDAWVKPAPRAVEAPVALLATGQPAPDLTLHDANGAALKLSDLRGKVVVLDFWATWCGPCRAALPHLESLAKTYGPQGVVVLAACTNDEREAFEEFIEEQSFRYPSLAFAHDAPGRSSERASRRLYGVGGIPHTFIVDRDGTVVDQVSGYAQGEVLVDAALAKAGVEVDLAVLRRAEEDLQRRTQRAPAATKGAAKGSGD